MKKILLILCFLPLLSIAQVDSSVFYLNTDFKVTFIADTTGGHAGYLAVLGTDIVIDTTNTGQHYTKYYNNGRLSRRYAGWLTNHVYEGMTVYSNRTGTRFYYLQLDKQGVPYRIELPSWVFGK